MDEAKVSSVDDMMAAADARLNAPIEPITTKVMPAGRGADPAPEDQPEPDDGDPGDETGGAPAADPEPEPESSMDVDGERLTTAQVRQYKRDAARVKEADEARRAAQYLLQHPEEYARVRREHGLEAPPSQERQPAPAATGPDPVDDPRGWKYERFNQYVAYLQQNGRTATHEVITAQVEQDHVHARTDRMHQVLLEERAQRAKDAEQVERDRAQWRQDQEAAQIARALTPLFTKYPQAATPQGQEEVEALIIRAVHLGNPVDYEAIVRRVHDRSISAVRDWSQKKRAMAGATGVAAGRGGNAQGSRAKLKDRLPADLSSLSEYAERASRGEV